MSAGLLTMKVLEVGGVFGWCCGFLVSSLWGEIIMESCIV